MAAITHGAGSHFADITHRITSQGLIVAALIAWAAIGPILFLYYGAYVNTLGWADLAAVPTLQADDVKAAYYVYAVFIVISGGIAWIAGLIVLAALALHSPADR